MVNVYLLWVLTFTSLVITFQSVTTVTSTRETPIVVKAKLVASIGLLIAFVDVLKIKHIV